MKLTKYLLLLSILLFQIPFLQGQTFDPGMISQIEELVPENINDSTPGLVIGIVHNGGLIYSNAYGKANLAYDIDNDSRLVYNIGSVSKQFLGYAFAILHQDGSLDLDDAVGMYLEDWPEFEHDVTLRHLLSHTSGYREAYTMSNLAGRIVGVDHLSRKECLDVVRRQPELEFIPGSRYTYNSTAWVILAEVFEKVKGQSAEEWIMANILEPLDMKNTQIETYVGEVIDNAAESYYMNDDGDFVNAESNRAIFGAAEVYSSVEDLAKWINNYKTAAIGGKKVFDLFLNPYVLNDGVNSQYALGIGTRSYRGLKRYKHTGSHEAFLSQLSYYPDHDLGIILVSNCGGRGWLSETDLVDILLAEHLEPKSTSSKKGIRMRKKKLEPFTGRYLVSDKNGRLDITVEDDSLTINDRTKLVPTSKNSFRNKEGNTDFIFKLGSDASMSLIERSSRSQYSYQRVEAWDGNTKSFSALEGDYWSDELETVYHLGLEDDTLKVTHRWLGEISLEPVAKDVFRTDWGHYVVFDRDETGKVSGLTINSGRTLNVKFYRKD